MTPATAIRTVEAPPPAGHYSQAVRAGDFVFLAGQTPRDAAGRRLGDQPFDVQVRQTFDNLQSVARACGGSLRDAVKVNIFVAAGSDMAVVDAIYSSYVGDPLPARTLTVSEFPHSAIEVDATLWLPQ